MKRDVTCYSDECGDLVTIDTAETLRRATAAERRESRAAQGGTGAIKVAVSERTLRARAPRLAARIARIGY